MLPCVRYERCDVDANLQRQKKVRILFDALCMLGRRIMVCVAGVIESFYGGTVSSG